MQIDKYYAAAKDTPVAWNDVREQRVLNRIQIETKRRSSDSLGNGQSRWVIAAAAGIAIIISLTLLLMNRTQDTGISTMPGDALPSVEETMVKESETTPSRPSDVLSVLGLQDAGRVVLFPDAEVSVAIRTDAEVRLDHTAGRARYEINKKRGRRVVIIVDSIQVEVVGTVFTIERTSASVRIDVERGTVRITQLEREMLLNGGESLELFLTSPVASKEAGRQEDSPSTQKNSKRKNGKQGMIDRVVSHRPVTRVGTPTMTADVLFALVDRERNSGNLERAAGYLSEIISSGTSVSKKVSAYITLGKIRRQQQQHQLAATTFCRCAARYSAHPLAEDALAECARSRRDAGDKEGTEASVSEYVSRYPDGIHLSWLRGLLK